MKHRTLFFTLVLLILGAVITIGSIKVVAQDEEASTFALTDGKLFSAVLPEGWILCTGSENPGFVNGAAILRGAETCDSVEPAPGWMNMTILALPKAIMQSVVVGGSGEMDEGQAVISFVAQQLSQQPGMVNISSATEMNLDENRVVNRYDVEQNGLVTPYLVFDIAPDFIGIIQMYTLPGEFELLEEEALQVAATVRYGLFLDQSYSADDESLRFSYPTNWKIGEVTDIFRSPFPVISPPESDQADDVAGTFAIYVLPLAPNADMPMLNLEDPQTSAVAIAQNLLGSEAVLSEPTARPMGDQDVVFLTAAIDEIDMGIFVVGSGDMAYAVVYQTPAGEAYQLELTAYNVAGSVQYTLSG